MSTKLSRRQFLLRTAMGAGASVLACGGASALAMIQPPVEPIEILSPTGETVMNQKILVAYATRCGSTIGVAEAIADELKNKGLIVDLKAIKHGADLKGYSGVVLGSAIRMGSWVPEALKFIETHQVELTQIPTAIFSVHMNNLGEDDASHSARSAYHDAVRKLVKPVSEAWFEGAIDMAKMSFLDRMITKTMKAVEKDKRDWPLIRQWGQTLSGSF